MVADKHNKKHSKINKITVPSTMHVKNKSHMIIYCSDSFTKWADMVGTVGKIFAFQPQGFGFDSWF